MAGKEYQMAFSIGAKLQGQFGAAFKSAQSSITSLQNTIASLNKQQGDIAAYQKQQKAVHLLDLLDLGQQGHQMLVLRRLDRLRQDLMAFDLPDDGENIDVPVSSSHKAGAKLQCLIQSLLR